jgi:DUF1365 family protein
MNSGSHVPRTGIYRGSIVHNRFSPKRHFFTYPVFIFAMDLDEIASWDRKLRLFSHNRFALYSLRDADHLGDPKLGIKANVLDLLRERGFQGSVDRIVMITQYRVLGHVFNPVTFYYCYRDGRAVAWVAEVNNTFHQRHCYAFWDGPAEGPAEFRAEKVFYVSPFMEMGLTYRYRFDPLNEGLAVFIDDYRGEEPVLKTHIAGAWEPMGDWNVLKTFLRFPFMCVWILAWIHWQAMKIWLKKIPQVFRPLDGMKPGWKGT